MARPQAVQVGLFYPTKLSWIETIAAAVVPQRHAGARSASEDSRFAIADPCCGEGEAVLALAAAIEEAAGDSFDCPVHGAEIEETRHAAAKATGKFYSIPRGDLLRLHVERADGHAGGHSGGFALVFLNPPYHKERGLRPLEERCTERAGEWVAAGGLLVLVVPYYALRGLAEYLSSNFRDVRCAQVPPEDVGAYKQVVLIARRRAEPAVDAPLRVKLAAWGAALDAVPAWDTAAQWARAYRVPTVGRWAHSVVTGWEAAPLDVCAVADAAPAWERTQGGKRVFTPEIVPSGADKAELSSILPVITPLKPAYVAAAVACGVYDGAVVEPDDAASGLPAILIRGMFRRVFATVDERVNEDGEKVGELQVQRPELAICVLDLSTGEFHEPAATTKRSRSRVLAEMTAADVLHEYNAALMAVMRERCPALYDPERDSEAVILPTLKRPLYAAQAHVARAAIRAIRGDAWPSAPRIRSQCRIPQILGEVGSGKSSIALAVAAAFAGVAKQGRTCAGLVLCPPHLVQRSWPNEARAVLGAEFVGDALKEALTDDVPVFVLGSVSAVDEAARWIAANPGRLSVSVLSREAAKLGYGREDARVRGQFCSACGADVRHIVDVVERRARCPGQPDYVRTRAKFIKERGTDRWARWALAIAPVLCDLRPGHALSYALVPARMRRRAEVRAEVGGPLDDDEKARRERRREQLDGMLAQVFAEAQDAGAWWIAMRCALAVGEQWMLDEVLADTSKGSAQEQAGRGLLALWPLALRREALTARHAAAYPTQYYYAPPLDDWQAQIDALASEDGAEFDGWRRESGQLLYDGAPIGDLDHAIKALEHIVKAAHFEPPQKCGEPLWQAAVEPSADGRKPPQSFPLADYILKRYRRMWNFFVLDEAHEHAHMSSAQTGASQKLMRAIGRGVSLTGSACSGYAESLFASQYARDPVFREEYDRDDSRAFVRDFGYVKQVVDDYDAESKSVVAFGAVSDRVIRRAREVGNAAGVSPAFLIKYLLRSAIPLHKTDLALDLPPHTDEIVRVELSETLTANAKLLVARTRDRISKDRFSKEGKAGKLFGALAELVSYTDCCTEDVCGPSFEVCYPPDTGAGAKRRGKRAGEARAKGEVVVFVPALPAETILPKEQAMLARLEAAFSAGSRVLVFPRHTALLQRLSRIVERELGVECPILYASAPPDGAKVRAPSAKNRQEWIEREVVDKGARVLVVNPDVVQTGLNVLVHFDTVWWHENPMCDAIIHRQANGRVDRIGKTRPTRSLYGVAGDLQDKAHKLLSHKVAVSLGADGLDFGSALEMAGLGGDADALDALSLGRQLYKILEEDDGSRG